MPDSLFQTFVDLLYASRRHGSYTLLLGSSVSFTPALLQTTGHSSWLDFYQYINKRISPTERTHLLETHFKTLQLQEGYLYLAQLIQEGYFRAVFTINIDTQLEDALNKVQYVSEHGNVIIRGMQADRQIVTQLQHLPAEQGTVCLLRGHIRGEYTIQEIFPKTLEDTVRDLLSGDILQVGAASNADLDIVRCISPTGGSIWYVSTDQETNTAIFSQTKQRNKNIIGDEKTQGNISFNQFFHTLADALHTKAREEKPHITGDTRQHYPQIPSTMQQQSQEKQIAMNQPDQQKRDFFISYTSPDRQWGEWIAWELEKAGYSVFIQAWDFLSGGNFVLDMQRASSNSKRTIIVLTENYLKSRFTQPEWAAAFAQDPTGEHGMLLPVRVRQCEPSGLLKPLVYIDIVGLNEEEARKRLLENVTQQRKKPGSAPLFPGQTSTEEQLVAAIKDPLLPEHPPYPQNLPPVPDAINIFYACSQFPVDEELRKQIEAQLGLLRQRGLINEWHSGKITAGKEWAVEIKKHWDDARIILLLISAEFISSSNYDLAKEAMKRHRANTAVVIPIILRPVDWQGAIFSDLGVLPDNKIPITSWSNRDEALLNVAQGIRKAIEELTNPGS